MLLFLHELSLITNNVPIAIQCLAFCRFSFREALKSGSTEPHRSFSVSSTLNGKRKIKGIIIGPPGSGSMKWSFS